LFYRCPDLEVRLIAFLVFIHFNSHWSCSICQPKGWWLVHLSLLKVCSILHCAQLHGISKIALKVPFISFLKRPSVFIFTISIQLEGYVYLKQTSILCHEKISRAKPSRQMKAMFPMKLTVF
jgi:hypothetical protein